MGAITLSGLAVLGGKLTMPARGAWTLECEVDSAKPPEAGAPAVLSWSGLRFVGTVRTSGAFSGRAKLKVVGGAGGLQKKLQQRAYGGLLSARKIFEDILRDAGETASGKVTLAGDLDRWIRPEQSGSQSLDELCDEFGASWRVLADGTIWAGEETWPAEASVFRKLSEDQARGNIVAAPDKPNLIPGTTILGVKATRLEYTIGPGPRVQIGSGETTERALLAKAVARNQPNPRYREAHPASVLAVSDDGATADVLCDDPAIGPLVAVPLNAPLPGARVVPDVGMRVRVHFDGGSPRKFHLGPNWDADPEAEAGVARVGDSIDCGTLAVVMVGTDAKLVYTPPGGTPSAPGDSVQLVGVVSSGSDMVKLRGPGV